MKQINFEIGNKPGQFYILDWLYEYWMPVKDAEEDYQVSNWGRALSNDYNHTGVPMLLKQSLCTKNHNQLYKRVAVTIKGKHMSKRVHRLVLEAHRPIENSDKYIINHKDENPENNCVWNLEWCDCKYNINYGTGLKRRSKARIENAKGTAIVVYKNGEFYKKYTNVISAARELKICRDSIFKRIYGKVKSDYKGYSFSTE